MKQHVLALHTGELDYVEHFQELARVNLELQSRGPAPARLLQKAILEMDVGNFDAARAAAQEALVLDPRLVEARYQQGVACLMSAFVRAGALAAGPGKVVGSASVVDRLHEAAACFQEVLEANRGDLEARDDLQVTADLLSLVPGSMAEAMTELLAS